MSDTLNETAAALRHAANNWLMVLGANLDLLARRLPPEGPEARQLARAVEAVRRLEAALPPFTRLTQPPALEDTRPDRLLAALAPLMEVLAGRPVPMELAALPALPLPRPGLDLALLGWAKGGESLELRAGPVLEFRPGSEALRAFAAGQGWAVEEEEGALRMLPG